MSQYSIPDIPTLREAFSLLRLHETENYNEDDNSLVICQPIMRTLKGGKRADYTTYLLMTLDDTSPINLDSLLNRVADALTSTNHVGADKYSKHRLSIAAKILALAISAANFTIAAIDEINAIIHLVIKSRAAQWVLFPAMSNSWDTYNCGDFVFGRINLDLLRSRSRRANSNYFELYKEAVERSLSVFRDSHDVFVAQFNEHYATVLNAVRADMNQRIIDDYYQNCAESLKELFLSDLDRQQAVYVASGLGSVSADFLTRVNNYCRWITIFTCDQTGKGWVVPTQEYPEIRTTEPKVLNQGKVQIDENLCLADWGKSTIDPIIQTYCEYLATATDSLATESLGAALLQTVYALDLLLGGSAEEALTKTLSERTALLTYFAIGKDMTDISEFIRKIYDMRSGYAHRGEKERLKRGIDNRTIEETLEKLTLLSRVVLAAACFARSRTWSKDEEAHKIWHKRIDMLRNKHDSKQDITDDDLRDLGINLISIDEDGFARISLAD